MQNQTSVMEATSALQCLKILQDEELFTQTDVIVMQFLCTETESLDLHANALNMQNNKKHCVILKSLQVKISVYYE